MSILRATDPNFKPTLQFSDNDQDLENVIAVLETLTPEQARAIQIAFTFKQNFGRHRSVLGIRPIQAQEEKVEDDYDYYNEKLGDALRQARYRK